MIDIHSHILPGLDDGSKSIEETLGIVRQLQGTGFKTILATPHVLEGTDFLSPAEILTATADVCQAVAEAGISVEILPGAENYIFPDMGKWVRAGKLLTLGNTGKYILVELPMLEIPHYTDQVFFELQVEGLTPVLAHPERYKGLFQEPERLIDWAKKGILFQLDLRSLSGRYGPQPKQLAERMLSSDLIHFVGSDAHRVSRSDSVDREALQCVRQTIGEKRFREVTETNPQRILEGKIVPSGGEYLLKEPEIKKRKHRFWEWFRG
ncbi:CpsB/CapC family capsule biosynthesis tyrosine phosphatase [Desulfosporosinus sp. Sb-LF]|uniref:tyrosine-protein phosphatase n=1 Tax=Desulfosporosinus sp. Sb-LF TaxID=2560027 RepID=UPI00107F3172|nr:CpsB/CapC family capsule biosynthesis tyrosine phosphatase [Desulfosporosinus sp. Sb-LF]TGE31911.1 histidinol-phosphatase [Desulfosporosinus sp. Sb-LF]